MIIHITNIDYCVEEEDVLNIGDIDGTNYTIDELIKYIKSKLPIELFINIEKEKNIEEVIENLADIISDKTGWLVNDFKYEIISNHVKFISYTGRYPNLCSGVLTLEIDGKEYRFGHEHIWGSWETDDNFDKFWWTGGSVWFSNGWADAHVDVGRWFIDKNKIPEQFQKYYEEIDEVFNDNVPYGCCGGCV